MEPPVFIIGNPRSGTTLLRLMLTCHRNIVIPPEGGFAVWLFKNYQHWTDYNQKELLESFTAEVVGSRKFETWHLSYNDVLSYLRQVNPISYAEAVSAIYVLYGKSIGRNFRRWGDKNNWYLNYIPTLKMIFPNVVFVHIVRDGRNVACSYRKLKDSDSVSKYAPKLPYEISDIAQEWARNLATINASFDAFERDNVYELRYEDLVSFPEATLTELCAFVGEPFDLHMLDYHTVNRDTQLEPKEFLQWKAKTLQPPQVDELEKYKWELTSFEIQTYNRIAESMLLRYQYLA